VTDRMENADLEFYMYQPLTYAMMRTEGNFIQTEVTVRPALAHRSVDN
jgi:hypothetical protein